jgi:hypothetical protein
MLSLIVEASSHLPFLKECNISSVIKHRQSYLLVMFPEAFNLLCMTMFFIFEVFLFLIRLDRIEIYYYQCRKFPWFHRSSVSSSSHNDFTCFDFSNDFDLALRSSSPGRGKVFLLSTASRRALRPT